MANVRKVGLACTECGQRNYTTKPSQAGQERLAVKKFCRYCGKHTLHKETK
ncbi:50S ribosomal protein L33 [Atopobacter phocae]|uniref:50S ribosomal protein L33 n=1 Tax=Atopobacter phocae TaxID=136492 RepID=UPI00046F6CD1|nr:50S ribosomal protein L33 [Atopobacter phocae]